MLEDVLDNILFLCIGDSNIIGDSLGPLIGSVIQKNKDIIQADINIEVIGTMELPIGYQMINNLIKNVKDNTFIIVIDSALGSENNIGKIVIDESNLCAGQGVNKGKYLKGDITIRGIVGKNHYNIKSNATELRNISTIKIDDMALKIISAIYTFLLKV